MTDSAAMVWATLGLVAAGADCKIVAPRSRSAPVMAAVLQVALTLGSGMVSVAVNNGANVGNRLAFPVRRRSCPVAAPRHCEKVYTVHDHLCGIKRQMKERNSCRFLQSLPTCDAVPSLTYQQNDILQGLVAMASDTGATALQCRTMYSSTRQVTTVYGRSSSDNMIMS